MTRSIPNLCSKPADMTIFSRLEEEAWRREKLHLVPEGWRLWWLNSALRSKLSFCGVKLVLELFNKSRPKLWNIYSFKCSWKCQTLMFCSQLKCHFQSLNELSLHFYSSPLNKSQITLDNSKFLLWSNGFQNKQQPTNGIIVNNNRLSEVWFKTTGILLTFF